MLKKMRWHFILAAMLAVFIMLTVVLAGINVWNSYTIAKRADERIEEIYAFEIGTPNSQPPQSDQAAPPSILARPEDHDPEAPYTTRFFVVRLDENGQVADVSTDYIASVTTEEAGEYAQAVINRKNQKGYYKSYRYQILKEDNEDIVIFLNNTMELHSAKNVLFISCLVGVGCFLIVFLLVFLLSGKAMKPYLENIERQKRFITDASHEIKTPLTSIATSVDVLEMEHGEDEWTRNIHKQTSKMSKMVADLVTLSRLDEENPFPDKTEFSLSDIAWEVAEPFSSLAREPDLMR